MIRYSTDGDQLQLHRLWKDVFHSKQEYINAFFQEYYSPEYTLVYEDGGEILSALYMIPYQLKHKKGVVPALYLYALATKEQARGRGIMSSLIQEAHTVAMDRGYACSFLIPAEPGLIRYYNRSGYVDQTPLIEKWESDQSRRLGQSGMDRDHSMVWRLADAGEIWDIYQKNMKNESEAIMLSEKQNQFFYRNLLAQNGEALVYQNASGDKGYALIQVVKKHSENKSADSDLASQDKKQDNLEATKNKEEYAEIHIYEISSYGQEREYLIEALKKRYGINHVSYQQRHIMLYPHQNIHLDQLYVGRVLT